MRGGVSRAYEQDVELFSIFSSVFMALLIQFSDLNDSSSPVQTSKNCWMDGKLGKSSLVVSRRLDLNCLRPRANLVARSQSALIESIRERWRDDGGMTEGRLARIRFHKKQIMAAGMTA